MKTTSLTANRDEKLNAASMEYLWQVSGLIAGLMLKIPGYKEDPVEFIRWRKTPAGNLYYKLELLQDKILLGITFLGSFKKQVETIITESEKELENMPWFKELVEKFKNECAEINLMLH